MNVLFTLQFKQLSLSMSITTDYVSFILASQLLMFISFIPF